MCAGLLGCFRNPPNLQRGFVVFLFAYTQLQVSGDILGRAQSLACSDHPYLPMWWPRLIGFNLLVFENGSTHSASPTLLDLMSLQRRFPQTSVFRHPSSWRDDAENGVLECAKHYDRTELSWPLTPSVCIHSAQPHGWNRSCTSCLKSFKLVLDKGSASGTLWRKLMTES